MTAYSFQQLIDFTRTSAGTFVGSNGLIQNSPQSRNLLTWTQEFDNAAWVKLNSLTVTANSTAAPDGTSTADTLVEPAATNIFGVRQPATLAAGTATFSVFIKPNGRNWVQLTVAAGGSGSAFFNVATGVVGTTSGATASIVNAGNGWYRCVLVCTASAGSNTLDVRLASADGTTSYTGNGTSGIFIWGAQLEQAATASDYTRNVGGLFPPRFDFDPVTLAPRGILIEEQRTNLQIRSEEFESSPWVRSNLSTVTANSSTAPDGTMTADLLVSAVGAGITGIAITSFAFSALTYTQSVFVKAATGVRYIQLLYTSGTTSNDHANFDLQTGTVTSGTYISASMTNFGNGWYRISMTSIATASTSGVWIIAVPAAASARGAAYTGNGTDGFRVWGAQLEAGAFATSYIPTVASQVTRTADQASIVAPMFAPWYNGSAGTFVFEGTALAASGFAWPLSASAGSAANAVSMYRSGAFVAGFIASSGTTQLEITSSPVVANVPYKAAVTAETNNGNFSFNGNIAANDTAITMPTVSRLSLGANAAGNAEFLNGHIRNIRYYPVRLSNTQLQALTA